MRIVPRVPVLEPRLVPAIFQVTNLDDASAGSLRAAVIAANSAAGADQVQFAVGLSGTITLTTGEISITESVSIDTSPGSPITINGNGAGRILNTAGAPAGAFVSMSGLTLTGGLASAGGAIAISDESVTLSRCVVTGNSATSQGGRNTCRPCGRRHYSQFHDNFEQHQHHRRRRGHRRRWTTLCLGEHVFRECDKQQFLWRGTPICGNCSSRRVPHSQLDFFR